MGGSRAPHWRAAGAMGRLRRQFVRWLLRSASPQVSAIAVVGPRLPKPVDLAFRRRSCIRDSALPSMLPRPRLPKVVLPVALDLGAFRCMLRSSCRAVDLLSLLARALVCALFSFLGVLLLKQGASRGESKHFRVCPYLYEEMDNPRQNSRDCPPQRQRG